MPYSDNLYSANDASDDESFSDELSPTDGYFNRRGMPTNMLVPDPSQDSNTADDKVLIARREARQNSELASRATDSSFLPQMYPSHTDASAAASDNSPLSPVSNTPSSPASSRRAASFFSEPTPFAQAPPPAYSASPTSPVAPVLPQTRTYSTFAAHQLEQGFPPRHEPESMGGPVHVPTERTPLSNSPNERTPLSNSPNERTHLTFSRRKSSLRRVLIRKLLFFALVVTILVTLLTTMLRWKSRAGHKDSPSYDGPSAPYCSSATIKKPEDSIIYEFGTGRDLTVVQTTHEVDDNHAAHVRTSGEIRLRRLPNDSERGPHFSLDVRVSDPELEIMKNWDEYSRTLRISTPTKYAKLDSRGSHCISLEITVWLPEDAKLANLKVESVTLSLRVLEDLKVNLSGLAQFGSVAGDISFPRFPDTSLSSFLIPEHSFNSRRVDIETISGAISGLYPLYDHLGLYSQSGSVNVGVFPRAIDPAAPAPANLEVKTSSSSINVYLPMLSTDKPKFTPPARDYTTQVQSIAGGISGSYYLGSSATFKSTSGKIGMKVLPVIQSSGKSVYWDMRESFFETRTESGTTNIEVLEPTFISLLSDKKPERPEVPYKPIGDDDPYLILPPPERELLDENTTTRDKEDTLRALRSSHHSTSGSISVQYPPAWEGTILAHAISGSIAITGKDVKTIHEKNGWASKEVLAKKGVDREGEGSSAEIRSVAGGIKFTVYDV